MADASGADQNKGDEKTKAKIYYDVQNNVCQIHGGHSNGHSNDGHAKPSGKGYVPAFLGQKHKQKHNSTLKERRA